MKLFFISILILFILPISYIAHANNNDAQIVEFNKIRKIADANKDGIISRNEFVDAYEKIYENKIVANYKYLVLDVDLDNQFDINEYLVSLDTYYMNSRGVFITGYMVYDIEPNGNEDNIVNYSEIIKYIKSSNRDVADEELKVHRKTFTEYDSNGDNKLEWIEFDNWYQKNIIPDLVKMGILKAR